MEPHARMEIFAMAMNRVNRAFAEQERRSIAMTELRVPRIVAMQPAAAFTIRGLAQAAAEIRIKTIQRRRPLSLAVVVVGDSSLWEILQILRRKASRVSSQRRRNLLPLAANSPECFI